MEIDARGLECPLPTERAVAEMRRARASHLDEEIVILTDDAVCADEIPHHARALGCDAGSHRAGAGWKITLRARSRD